jgi:hypothetical protein
MMPSSTLPEGGAGDLNSRELAQNVKWRNAAEFLKRRNPHSDVAVKDLQSGEVIPALYRPEK